MSITLTLKPTSNTKIRLSCFWSKLTLIAFPCALIPGHHAYRGGDPIAFMRRHHDRIRYLHLKNVDPEIQNKVEHEKIPFAPAVGMEVFCELDRGAVDFLAFRDVLQEVDYEGWAVVEQDMYPAPFDKHFPIGKRNREYLREIGIG